MRWGAFPELYLRRTAVGTVPEPRLLAVCPGVPPLLPPIPTGTLMFRDAEEQRHEEKLANLKHVNAMMKAMLGKSSPNKEINDDK